MAEVVLRGDKQCPHGHTARRKCEICDRNDDLAEIDRLRQELSLAEEGLANATQENGRLIQSNLAFLQANKSLADINMALRETLQNVRDHGCNECMECCVAINRLIGSPEHPTGDGQ